MSKENAGGDGLSWSLMKQKVFDMRAKYWVTDKDKLEPFKK